jgi:hypothetical protein
VKAFLDAVKDAGRRDDCRALDRMMRRVTGQAPRMWGPSIVGYGSHTMRYANGRELEWFVVGFSPRAQALTVYVMGGLRFQADRLARLGRHKVSGGGCLYLRRLADVDTGVLELILAHAQRTLGTPGAPPRVMRRRTAGTPAGRARTPARTAARRTSARATAGRKPSVRGRTRRAATTASAGRAARPRAGRARH